MTVVDRQLKSRFGTPKWDGPGDPLAGIIGTILSQNTNDLNSDRAYRSLRKVFPRWEMLLDARPRRIARAIRVGGLANQKSRRIKDFLKWVKRTYGRLTLKVMHGMSVEEAVETFTRHKGIGLKTIYVTLLFACGKDVFPVDTHIYRIVRRLALVPQRASRDKVTELMQVLVGKGESFALHLNLIAFGRTVCKAQKPLCRDCPFPELCLHPDKNLTPPKSAAK